MLVGQGTPGAYVASFSALAQLSDLWISEIKAVIFGFIAGLVACYRGLNPKGGPKGVFVISVLYIQLVPAKGA